MTSFFSNTDIDTLQEEGDERNHFVSLIVNNAGKYTAAITRKIKYTSVRNLSYEGFDGPVDTGQETIDGEEIEYFYLDVIFEKPQDNEMKEIADRLSSIKEAKKKATPIAASTYGNSAYDSLGYSSYINKNLNKDLTTYEPKQASLFDDLDDGWWGKGFGSTPIIQQSKKGASELVDTIIAQLISGNVTCTKLEGSNKEKMLNTMERRFESRFGKGDEGMMLFEYWATDFIEFLTWYSIDEEKGITPEKLTADIVKELDDLSSSNKYIERYIELLTVYEDKF